MCSTKQGQAVVEVIFVGSFEKLSREKQTIIYLWFFLFSFQDLQQQKKVIKQITFFYISSKSLI